MSAKYNLSQPTPRRCSLCRGKGGTSELPCLSCNGAGWVMPYSSAKPAGKPAGEFSDEVPML
jgi:DnaJ-class molecular chaperone